jgi:aspartate-semialdehyde dehydrogenase
VNVAVVGATGVVGETILRVLEERNVPVGALGLFASRERTGAARFRGDALDVRAASEDALRDFDVVFFAGSEDASERYAPALVRRGCFVIDNSSTFRMRGDVPLIVPGVNADAMRAGQRLFPVANCTAIVLCTALRPIRDAAGLRSVAVATYQAASGAGRAGLEELLAQELSAASGAPERPAEIFPRPLARNVVPQVGALDESGWSGEERKIRDETRKMLDLPELRVTVTAVRVPVRTAHSGAVFLETQRPTSLPHLAAALSREPGIVYHPDGIVTPRDVEGTDDVHVARLRADDNRRFSLWCVGDQLRRGAATNAVQILELLLAKGYIAA